MVGTGIRRPHHPAVQHAGHAHVVHEDEFARQLGRDVDARLRGADDAVVVRMLQFDVMRQLQHGALAGHELAESDAALRCIGDVNHAVANDQRVDRRIEPCRGTRN